MRWGFKFGNGLSGNVTESLKPSYGCFVLQLNNVCNWTFFALFIYTGLTFGILGPKISFSSPDK